MDNCRSLQAYIAEALTEAANLYKECCHDSNEAWEPFYAEVIARRLAPVLCGIQASQPTPIAHVRAHFVDYPSPASLGAQYASRKRS